MAAHRNERGVSRRQFLGGAGLLAATGAFGAAGLSGCAGGSASSAGSAVTLDFSQTVAWDAEYDVVVVGWGGAGSVTAITAAENGAHVLLTEKAPYGDEGGNTRYCEQYFLVPKTYEDGVAYFTALAEGFDSATDEIIDFMAKGSMDVKDWLLSHGASSFEVKGDGKENVDKPDSSELRDWGAKLDDGSILITEYPTWPNGEQNKDRIQIQTQVDAPDEEKKKYWNLLRRNIVEMKDRIDVWYESPAVKLIQDPFSKAILGVRVSKKGSEVNVRAKNGVVLTCGSYEASPQMMQDHAQILNATPYGSLYNTGDGIPMAQEVGASLWHMRALSGPVPSPKRHNSERGLIVSTTALTQRITKEGNCFNVGGNGKRFMKESGYHKHGHVNVGGTYMNQQLPSTMWAIMDATARNGSGVVAYMHEDDFEQANTIEELAGKIGVDAAALVATAEEYNAAAAAGVDVKFDRPATTLKPVETPPFFAARLWPCFINTQAGPRRNTRCEVLNNDGAPIPNLYSAGELGSFWAGVYVCGGNICETVYSGRVAGANAAEPKEEPQATELAVVSSAPAALGNDLDESEASVDVELGQGEYLGTGQGLHGEIVAKVKVEDGKVVAVDVVKQTETPDITEKVWTDMPAAMVASGGSEVDTVTGATIASEGLIAAVEDALGQAR